MTTDSRCALTRRHRLDGVRVAITGGTSGLGLALVARGPRPRGACRLRRADARARRRVGTEHPGAHGIVGDVAQKEDIYPIALQIAGNLGGLDVLVNNASSLGPVPLALWPTRRAKTSSWRWRPTCSGRFD